MRTGDRSRHEGCLGGRIESPLRWVEFGGNRRDGVKVTIKFLPWEAWEYFGTVLRKRTHGVMCKVARNLRRHDQ